MRYADAEKQPDDLVALVRNTCRKRLWREGGGETVLRELNVYLSEYFRVEPPGVFVDGSPPHYQIWGRLIRLDKPSLVSFLHEFAHHIYGSSETKARVFSTGLFLAAFPRLYARACKRGTLLYQ